MFARKFVSQFLIILFFSSIAWLPAKAQSEAETIIQSWVDAADQLDLLTVSYDNIDHDENSGITIVNDLLITISVDSTQFKSVTDELNNESSGQGADEGNDAKPQINYIFNFPTIEFDNLSFDGDYYSANSIKAPISKIDFDLANTGQSSSSASGEYRNMIFNNIRWAALPEVVKDPAKPVSSYFPLVQALLDMSFDSASIDGVDMVQEMDNPKSSIHTSYGRMEVGKTVRGNFSSMTMETIRMESSGAQLDGSSSSPAMPRFLFEIENVIATDYNYRTFINILAPENVALDGNSAYQPMLGHMSLNNLRMDSDEANFTMKQMATSDIGVKAPSINLLGEIDEFIKLANEGKEVEDTERLIRFMGSLYGLFRLGEFEISGIEFSAKNQVQGGLDSFRIADLSSDGLGEYSVHGVNFSDNKNNSFDLGSFSLSDIRFPTLAALINLEQATKAKNIAQIMKAIPTLAKASLKGLLVNVEGQGEVSVDETTLSMADFIGPIPTNIQLLTIGAKTPVSIMDREPREMLTAMGYQEIDVSYDIRVKWQELGNLISVDADSELTDGGVLSFDFDIGGIPRSIFENPQTVQSAVAFATLDNATIEFSDNSLVEKGLRLAGAMQGVNADTMKAQVIGMIPVLLQQLEKPAFVDQLTATVKDFLDNRGSIRASALPQEPILILQLMGAGAAAPGAVIDLLNVSVESFQ